MLLRQRLVHLKFVDITLPMTTCQQQQQQATVLTVSCCQVASPSHPPKYDTVLIIVGFQQ